MKKSIKAIGITFVIVASILVMTQAANATTTQQYTAPYPSPWTNLVLNYHVGLGTNRFPALSSNSDGSTVTDVNSVASILGVATGWERAGFSDAPSFSVPTIETLTVYFNYTIYGNASIETAGVPFYGTAGVKLNLSGEILNQNDYVAGQGVWTIINSQVDFVGGWYWTFNGMHRSVSFPVTFVPGNTYSYTTNVNAETSVVASGAGASAAGIYISTTLDSITIAGDPQVSEMGNGVDGSMPILMQNGSLVDTQDIKVGNHLETFNPVSGGFSTGTVSKVNTTNQLEEVTVNNVSLAPYEYVLTENGWIQAINITLIDSLYNAQTNSFVPVTSYLELTGNYVMYNIQVRGNDHAYIAGGSVVDDQPIG